MRRVQLLLPLTCQVKPDVSFAFCIFWRSILALHDLFIFFGRANHVPGVRVSSLVLPRGIGIHHAGAELEPAKGNQCWTLTGIKVVLTTL